MEKGLKACFEWQEIPEMFSAVSATTSDTVEVLKGNCLCDTLTNMFQLLSALLCTFSFMPLHLAHSLSLPLSLSPSTFHTHSYTCVTQTIFLQPDVLGVGGQRALSLKTADTCTVSVGRGVSLCRNAGMISCGGVRGESHAVTARYLKTLHPKPPPAIFSFLFSG